MTPEIKQRIQQIRQGKTPKGYKKTKEGIIPNEWNVKLLGELSDVCSGQNTMRIPDGKYPVYGSTGVISSTNNYKYDIEQILVARVGAHAGYVQIASGKYDVSDNTLIVLLNDKCNIKYLYYNLINNNLNSFATGSGQPLITASQLKKLKLPLPPLPEQTAIAEILSTQDRVIELKEQLLAEKKRQKKYLMQQLLTGKKRLKGFKGEWKRCKLGEVCHYVNIHGEGRICDYVTTENIKPDLVGEVSFDEGNRVISGIKYSCDDILIANIRPYLRKIWKSNKSGVSSADVLVVRCDDVYIDYLYFSLANDDFFDYVMKSAKGSKMPRGDKEHIMNRMIYVPSTLPEQTAIAEILSTADREIELLGQSIEAEKQKKKSLMQLLLTGIVRVDGV